MHTTQADITMARPATRRADPTPHDWDDLETVARELDALLERGEDAEVLDALRGLAKHFGGVGAVAQAAGLNRTFLYRMLSPAGNPEMRTVAVVLRTLGLRLSIRPLGEGAPAARTVRPRTRPR